MQFSEYCSASNDFSAADQVGRIASPKLSVCSVTLA
jgi:hypothetical protein